MVLTSDGKKIIGYSKGTNAANSGFIGTGDAGGTLGVLEGTNACEVAFNGKRLRNFTFNKPTNAAFNTLVQSHVVHTDRVDPADGPTHPYKCTCYNANGTLYTRNTPGNFYINPNISYMVCGISSANKMNALNIFGPGTLNNVTNVQGAFNNALMFDWNWDTDRCDFLTEMFVGCDFNNSNITFNTVNGDTFLIDCTNVGTCRVRQNGGTRLPGMKNSSINVVDLDCNVNGGIPYFFGVNANVFNFNANIFNYSFTYIISHCNFVASSINLNFNNSALYEIFVTTQCNANINGATAHRFCYDSNGNYNITNSKASIGAFIASTGAVNANLSNCTISETVLNGSNINNSRITLNACTYRSVLLRATANNIIINEYNGNSTASMISNSTVTNTKCYWDNCNSYGFYNVNGSTEQHWENSIVQCSIDFSKNSTHNVFLNNVIFGKNIIKNLNNCKVNCDIISNTPSAYYTLLHCNNSVVNLNQTGNAGCPAGFCNNLKLNYCFFGYAYNSTSGASASVTSPIQNVYNSNIFAFCYLNSCAHTNAFAAKCKDTKITLHDFNKNASLYRTVLTDSYNINLQYYCANIGRMYNVKSSTVYGNLILNDCSNISGTITTPYSELNLYNVNNSNIVLSPSGATPYFGNMMQYCNNVKVNYTVFYNVLPVNYNTCSNMFLVTNSGNSVQFAPNNTRFDLDNVSLHNQMIVSNRCVALQGSKLFVQTVSTPGNNFAVFLFNLESNTLIGGTSEMNASYMAGGYKVLTPSNNVRCIGMINNIHFDSYPSFISNSVMRVNITDGTGLTFINNSYYATNNMDLLNAYRIEIDNCAFIARDTSLWPLHQSYVNNSVCVLGGQSTKWNTNRDIQFDNCLVIAVNWNRATYNQVMFTNCILVSSSAFGVINNTTHFKSLSYGAAISKYNACMPSKFKMPIEGFKMLTGVTDAPDSSDISI